MADKGQNSKFAFGIVLGAIGVVLVFLFFYYWSTLTSKPEAPAQIQSPLSIYDVLIEINPGTTLTEFRCKDPDSYESLGSFKAESFSYEENNIDYVKSERNGVIIQYRVKYPIIRDMDIMSPGLTELLNKSKYRVECIGNILEGENKWSYNVYDNGKKETHDLVLYNPLTIICDPHGYADRWECNWVYGYAQVEPWDLSKQIEKDIIKRALEKEGY